MERNKIDGIIVETQSGTEKTTLRKEIKQSKKKAMLIAMWTFATTYIALICAVIIMIFKGIDKLESLIVIISAITANLSLPIMFYFNQHSKSVDEITIDNNGGF